MQEILININIIIADRSYPLKVKPAEEENIRKAAKLINDKIKDFSSAYDVKDKQDYLAMSALTFAVESINKDEQIVNDQTILTKKLEELKLKTIFLISTWEPQLF